MLAKRSGAVTAPENFALVSFWSSSFPFFPFLLSSLARSLTYSFTHLLVKATCSPKLPSISRSPSTTLRPRRIRLAATMSARARVVHFSWNCVTCPGECYWPKTPILPFTATDRANRAGDTTTTDTRSISIRVSSRIQRSRQRRNLIAHNYIRNFLVTISYQVCHNKHVFCESNKYLTI